MRFDMRLPECDICGAQCVNLCTTNESSWLQQVVQFACGAKWHRSTKARYGDREMKFPDGEFAVYAPWPDQWKIEADECKNAAEMVRRMREQAEVTERSTSAALESGIASADELIRAEARRRVRGVPEGDDDDRAWPGDPGRGT